MADEQGPPEALPGERELARALRLFGPPVARDEFRAACRRAFLAAATPAEDGSQAGGPPRSEAGVSDVIERVLRSDPRRPRARDGFRDELRGRFVGGPAADEEPAPSGGRLLRFAAVVAGIAAAVLVTFFLPEPPRWRVTSFAGDGAVDVSGATFRAPQVERLTHVLAEGGRLRADEAELELSLEDWLVVCVRPGTTVDLGRPDGLLEEGRLPLLLERGEVFVRTRHEPGGGPPEGAVVSIETADGRVDVLGTVLGVDVNDERTCVCVARGSVRVYGASGAAGDPETVPEGSSLLFSSRVVLEPMRNPLDVDDPGMARHTAPLVTFAGRP